MGCKHDWSGKPIDGQFKKCRACGVIGASLPGGSDFVPILCDEIGCDQFAVYLGLRHPICKNHAKACSGRSTTEAKKIEARRVLGL